MTIAQQIIWGSAFLSVCIIIQIAIFGLAAHVMHLSEPPLRRVGRFLGVSAFVAIAVAAIICALTIQVSIWAWVWIKYDILADLNSAIYFSMVTFTSLGYGDIVLGPEARIFATFGSVTGLLAFGLNTAFIVFSMSSGFKLRN